MFARCFLLGCLVAILGPSSSLAQEVDGPAVIVRTVKPKSVTGDAADWDALRAEHAVVGAYGTVAGFKCAYDADHFYAWVRVRDESPLKNDSNVIEELFKGGDAIGFCFGPAGKKGANQRILAALVQGKPVVLALRPQSAQKKPYTFRSVGSVTLDYVAPLADAEASFVKAADGYVARVRLPWKSLGISPDDAAEIPFDVQVILSDAAGSTNAATAWWHSEGQGPLATTDLATEARLYPQYWGKARFVADDPGPRPVRPPAADDQAATFIGPGEPITFTLPRAATVSLIIRRDDGWVVRELLRARKLPQGKHTVYWDGRDRTGQPMPAGEYGYRLGVFDGVKVAFAGSVGNSGRPVWRTTDGLGSIGGTHGGPSAVAAGVNGVYMLHSVEEGQKCLRLIDPATGKARWFASVGVFGTGYAVTEDAGHCFLIHESGKQTKLVRFDAATGKSAPFGKQNFIALGGRLKVRGLAVVAGKAYFSVPEENRIGVIDLATGEAGKDIAVAAALGMCKLDDKMLLVCAGKEVLAVDVATGQAKSVITGLEAPRAVALDALGNRWVVDQGKSQQLKKFSPDGKLLASIGKEGGRGLTAAAYDPLAFRDLAGVAVGPDGNLWVVEPASPRRFVKLTPEGKWLEDFYGPTGYSTVAVDLDDVTQLTYQADQYGPAYIQARIDYAAYAKNPGHPVGAWQVEALHYLSQNGKDATAQPDLMTDTAKAGYGRALIFKATNGQRYLFKAHGNNFALWRWDAGAWISAAAVRARKVEAKEEAWTWADANGDGLVQDDEVSKAAPPTGGFTWIDRDLTIHGRNGAWKPAKIHPGGAPVYAGGAFTPDFPAAAPPLGYYLDQENYGLSHAPPGANGARYHCCNVGVEQGRNFWDRASEARLCRFVNGKLQWMIGHHDGRFRHNGDSVMLMNIVGELDGVVIASEVASNFTAYTTDGLTLGWLAVDARGRPSEEGPTAWYVENVQAGLFIKDPKTGKRLLVGASTEDVRVVEIAGVFGNDIARTDGKVTLRSAQPRRPALAGQAAVPYQTYTMTQGGRYLGADAYDTEWQRTAPSISILENKALTAEVRLRRDAGQLAVFADVLSATPLPEGKEAAFGKCDGVELLLGPAAPASRETAGPGDTRIFLTARREKGKLVGAAYACRPASPSLPASDHLRRVNNKGEFDGKAPAGALDFSRGLTLIPGAAVAVRERFDGCGWRLEAEIPLALVPELTQMRTVEFARGGKIKAKDERLDLVAPFRLNVAVHRSSKDGVQRTSWLADGAPADDRTMNPARWGHANSEP